jgi:hypothetical protein
MKSNGALEPVDWIMFILLGIVLLGGTWFWVGAWQHFGGEIGKMETGSTLSVAPSAGGDSARGMKSNATPL